MTKLVLRGAAALAMLALATPALPCGGDKPATTTEATPTKDAVAAKTPATKAPGKAKAPSPKTTATN